MKPENTSPELSKYPKAQAEFEEWAYKEYKKKIRYSNEFSVGKKLFIYSQLGGFDISIPTYISMFRFLQEKAVIKPDQVPDICLSNEPVMAAAIEAGFARLEAA